MSCITSTVTLQPGQPFVLPAGATIIGATDSASLTSVNDCADLTNVEDFACYAIQVQESVSDGGDAAYNNVYITGAVFNGVSYTFSTAVDFVNCSNCTPTTSITQLQDALAEIGIAGAFTDWSGYADDRPNSGDRAMITLICFKTIPSIATNLVLNAYANTNGGGSNVPIIIPILTADEMLTQYLGGGAYDDFINACSCYNPA
jgi:hypothetical protein